MIQEELNLHQSSHVEAFVFKLASKQDFQSFDLRLVWRILVNIVTFLKSTSTNIISFTAVMQCTDARTTTSTLRGCQIMKCGGSSPLLDTQTILSNLQKYHETTALL
jgi:hypothetical protein